MTAIREATLFATVAHEAIGQKRKFSDEPYIAHPLRVAEMIKSLRHHTWQMAVVALLHDVVEDTHITNKMIEDEFGWYIAGMVADLTNADKTAGNRKARLELNIERLKQARTPSKTVKVADIYDNLFGIAELDLSFAKLFVSEKRRVMEEALSECGDSLLYELTMERIRSTEKKIAQAEAVARECARAA
jgi:(p)ppGpp synthase/HD superfamily hydrolase